MRVSWDLIRSFEAVAESGSLSAASRKLGLSQPTLGRHINLLEEALNVALFTRAREGMRLTDNGADLVATAREMARGATGFERLASGLDEDVSGTIRLSANEIFGVLILPGLLGRFQVENPRIEVELVVSNSASNLLQRDADVAVRMFRPVQSDLVARQIATLPLGLYAHRDYLARCPAPATLSELRGHSFIGFDRETSLIEAALSLGAEFAHGDFSFRCDSILAHIVAIRSGAGIGVTHQGLAGKWGDVARVLPDVSLPGLDLWIACHADVRYNKRVRLMMDFLGQTLKNQYASMAWLLD